MGEYVWLAVVLLLALYGLTQGVGRLMLWMWRPRGGADFAGVGTL